MKYYFPIHLDGGNRGCEAIAKGTALLLESKAGENIGLCRDIELDTRLGLAEYVTLYPSDNLTSFQKVLRSLEVHLTSNPQKRGQILQKYDYLNFFKPVTFDDIMLSTGGDMMCYVNNQVNYTNNLMHNKGVKTILWGCSMGPENLTPEKEETLRNFSLVYARESLTYDFFKSLGLQNVCLYPDPAFILKPQECELPEGFGTSEVVGLNLSNFVLGDFSLDKPFGKEVSALIDYILEETNLHILLVPHVTWPEQDDRKVARKVREQYGNDERISILDVDKLNYCQIRKVIGHCKYFIGGRTHAVISAYSMCVPAIALGYSIKSRGIAKDLKLDEEFVVDSKHITKGQLLKSFHKLQQESENVRSHLESIMPLYKERTFGIRNNIKQLKSR